MKFTLIIWILTALFQEVVPGTIMRDLRENEAIEIKPVVVTNEIVKSPSPSSAPTSLQTEYEAQYHQENKCGNGTKSCSTLTGKQEFIHNNCGDNWNDFAEKCASLIKDLVSSLANAISSNPGDTTNLQLHIKNNFKHFDCTSNCSCSGQAKKILESSLDSQQLGKSDFIISKNSNSEKQIKIIKGPQNLEDKKLDVHENHDLIMEEKNNDARHIQNFQPHFEPPISQPQPLPVAVGSDQQLPESESHISLPQSDPISSSEMNSAQLIPVTPPIVPLEPLQGSSTDTDCEEPLPADIIPEPQFQRAPISEDNVGEAIPEQDLSFVNSPAPPLVTNISPPVSPPQEILPNPPLLQSTLPPYFIREEPHEKEIPVQINTDINKALTTDVPCDDDLSQNSNAPHIIETPLISDTHKDSPCEGDCSENTKPPHVVLTPHISDAPQEAPCDDDATQSTNLPPIIKTPLISDAHKNSPCEGDCAQNGKPTNVILTPHNSGSHNDSPCEGDCSQSTNSPHIIEAPLVSGTQNGPPSEGDCSQNNEMEQPILIPSDTHAHKDSPCEGDCSQTSKAPELIVTPHNSGSGNDSPCEGDCSQNNKPTNVILTPETQEAPCDDDSTLSTNLPHIIETPPVSGTHDGSPCEGDCSENTKPPHVILTPQNSGTTQEAPCDDDSTQTTTLPPIIETAPISDTHKDSPCDGDCSENGKPTNVILTSHNSGTHTDSPCEGDCSQNTEPSHVILTPQTGGTTQEAPCDDDSTQSTNSPPIIGTPVISDTHQDSPCEGDCSQNSAAPHAIVTPQNGDTHKDSSCEGDCSQNNNLPGPILTPQIGGTTQEAPCDDDSTQSTNSPHIIGTPVISDTHKDSPCEGDCSQNSNAAQPDSGGILTNTNVPPPINTGTIESVKSTSENVPCDDESQGVLSSNQQRVTEETGLPPPVALQPTGVLQVQDQTHKKDDVIVPIDVGHDNLQKNLEQTPVSLSPPISQSPIVPIESQNQSPIAGETDCTENPTTYQTTSIKPTQPLLSLPSPTQPSISHPLTTFYNSKSGQSPTPPTEQIHNKHPISTEEDDVSLSSSHDEDDDCCSCESCSEEKETSPREFRKAACKDLEEARRELKAIFEKIRKKLNCGRRAGKICLASKKNPAVQTTSIPLM